ncbi:MAG: hypothetical protein AB7U75_08855, partial [Hyphomicrobiaceae bacterium]
ATCSTALCMSSSQNRCTLLRDMLYCPMHVVIAKPLHTFARHALLPYACRHRKTAAHFCATCMSTMIAKFGGKQMPCQINRRSLRRHRSRRRASLAGDQPDDLLPEQVKITMNYDWPI